MIKETLILFLLLLSACPVFAANPDYWFKFDDHKDTNDVNDYMATTVGATTAAWSYYDSDANKDYRLTLKSKGTSGNLIYCKVTAFAGLDPKIYITGDVNIIIYVKAATHTAKNIKDAWDACSAASQLADCNVFNPLASVKVGTKAKTYFSGGTDLISSRGVLHGEPYYLMACHDANVCYPSAHRYDSNNLYLFESDDGKAFRLLNGGSSYHETDHQFRDPAIFKHTDGYYYCAYTNNNYGNFNGNRIGILKSADKINWSFVTWITFTGAGYAWAPEWYVDPNGSVYLFTSINKSGYKIVETHPTNVAFTAWSTPVSVTFSNFTGRPIDPYIVKVGSTYYLWFSKVQTGNYVQYATSANIYGPYTTVQDANNWAGWGAREGESLMPLDNGKWRIYFETPLGAVGYSESTGTDFNSWGSVIMCTDDSSALWMGHGTVIHDGSGRWTSQHAAAGKVGGALYFNGTTDYIDTKNVFSSDFNDSFSVSILCKPDDGQPPSDQVLCGSHTQGEDGIDSQFIIRLLTSGKINVTYYSARDNGTTLDSPVSLFTDGEVDSFHHIAGVVEKISHTQIKVKIYFDGVLVGESAVVDSADMSYYSSYNTKNLYIGAYNDNGEAASYYSGVLDDIRIYDKALTGEEIAAINDPNLPDNTAPSPNPITWEIEPNATSGSSITMTATEATDISGVEYYFANITDPNHDSNWVAAPEWTDTGLTKNKTYTYKVKARDASANHNETAWSNPVIAATLTWDCNTPLASDIAGDDCQVNFFDFAKLADAWGTYPPTVDLNHDGVLDFYDIAQFALDWLACNRSPASECWK